MKIIEQLFFILLFSLIGEVVAVLLSPYIAVPGPVMGMLILFAALHFGWIKKSSIKMVGTWLTDNMAIFFVPAGVGLMTHFDTLQSIWWQLLLVVLITVIVLLICIGKFVQKFIRQHDQLEEVNE
ncbi:CidA/LrgA family protein [Falseniella ignava]|uniref:CidA/LrgA family protein n=1 Tax=Falseniella ignava TaxID=137730 RepID=A0A2I1K562_9LACT|nr:CidA/LrgA family protein [Falseniella ignava]PKY90695.1 CidA/LrgA family protein [Falseniella ignava]